MPDDTQQTLNPDGINQMVGASSAPVTSDGLNDQDVDTQRTNTVDDPAVSSTVKDDAKDDKDGKDTNKVNEDKEKQDKAHDGDDDRLDKHPRFKEVIEDRNREREARIRAEERAKVLEEQQARTSGKEKTGDEEKLPFEDISQLSDEELDERWTDNKKKFIGNLYLQIRHELKQEFKQEAEKEQLLTAQEKDFNDFRKAHPDYDNLFTAKGGILDYMKDHPGTTRKEAYFALTEETRVKEAVEKAVEAERKKFDANRKAKRDASNVLGTGSPASGGGNDVFQEKLKDTSKHGGLVSVLADKINAMRRSSGG